MKQFYFRIWVTKCILLMNICSTYAQDNTFLKVKYLDFSLETIIAIPCEQFKADFLDIAKYWIPNKEDSILFGSLLRKFNRIKADYIDARAEIIFKNGNGISEMCMDKFGVFTDGKYFYKNKKLFYFLKNRLKQK